ncbi:ABC transporter permease [Caproiciproducens sp. NJN-50]|uniref:ABC transporter permease n=1 Tax=Caproiciproducens sp. NJN-50 TaxID=2507162 RepID=UPI000FFDF85C|nr:ABC transporter permease [Caproiciproducens sp. NJN-50]QAT49934.1 ABC transporter permease [Caproiciproducens sp. NJN-50]
MVWTFPILVEQVIKNNMTTVFPVCITLIAGYIIAREQKDDTLKNILTVPLTFKRLLVRKLLVCGLISLFLGLVCTVFTILAGLLTGFPGFSTGAAVQGLMQITFLNLFLYISVMLIIILTSRSANGFLAGVVISLVYGYGGMFAAGSMKLANLYPITASLGMIHYRSYEVHWNIPLCCLSIAVMLAISTVLILSMSGNVESKKPVKNKAKHKAPLKKGW